MREDLRRDAWARQGRERSGMVLAVLPEAEWEDRQRHFCAQQGRDQSGTGPTVLRGARGLRADDEQNAWATRGQGQSGTGPVALREAESLWEARRLLLLAKQALGQVCRVLVLLRKVEKSRTWEILLRKRG